MITVEEFVALMIDGNTQRFNIWDCEKNEFVFVGYGNKIPDEFLSEDVSSIDNIYDDNKGFITLNIR